MFEGELNLYVIAGDPLTLVDTGIGTPEALVALEKGLWSHGLSIDDVRQVVLTHKHADHIGLAGDIRERSGRDGLRSRGRLGRRGRSRRAARRFHSAGRAAAGGSFTRPRRTSRTLVKFLWATASASPRQTPAEKAAATATACRSRASTWK